MTDHTGSVVLSDAKVEARPALEIDNLSSGYGTTQVLRNVSFVAFAGQVTALLGSNGAGKSTLLNTAAGLIRPTEGSVKMYGKDVSSLRPYRRAKLGLCHVPEGRAIFRSLTVRENIALQSSKGKESEAVQLVVEAFPALKNRLTQQAGTMSGGQQQMLAVARAYVQNPKLILVDEPSFGLAPIVVDEIFEFLERMTNRGAALVIVDQFVSQALQMATKAYVLRRGEMAYAGPARDLLGDNLFEQYFSPQ
ncbi:MAG: ABC transporter ATP-binding protein [Hyphomicrobiales bacterium]|nr:MAG: ABC transporter ATP-binding protein [Hyphomicrobiales bacterium]